MKSIRQLLYIPLLALLTTSLAFAATSTVPGLTQLKTDNPKARQEFLQGWEAYRQGSPQALASAVHHFESATQLDPEFAQAYAALAGAYWDIAINGWSRALDSSPTRTRELSRLNLSSARKQPSALSHRVTAERTAHFDRKAARALAGADQAIELDAADPSGHLAMAAALLKADKPAEAAASMRTAMELDPQYPAFYLKRLGQAEFAMGQYEEAAETLEKAVNGNPDDDWCFVYLAAAYAHLGRNQEAKHALKTANTLRAKAGWGSLTIQTVAGHRDHGGRRYYFNWLSDYKPLREGLRKAGVAQEPGWQDLIISGPAGFEVKGATTIDTETAKTLHERGVPFIDIWFAWTQNHIVGAHFQDVWTYEINDASLPEVAGKNQEIVIYSSRSGENRWTPEAVARAVSWGYKKIYFYRDGLDAWKAAGYEVETVD